jgi:hypothetical protein
MIRNLTICFDWGFWSLGVLTDFREMGLIVVLIGPLRVNVLSEPGA